MDERESRTTLQTILRAFGSRNYRLFYSGQCVSLIGTWMQNIAMSWLVYRLTNSAFMLGAVGFAGDIFCFLLNGLSYIAVILALLVMRIEKRPSRVGQDHILRELKEGYTYAFSIPAIRNTILLLTVVSLMGMSYAVLMPVVASEVLHGGPRTLGMLMGAAGCGALVAAISLAARESVAGLARNIPLAGIIGGCALIALAFSTSSAAALPAMFMIGFGMLTLMASSNTLIQTTVDDDKRGRVMGIYAMAFRGMAPFGSLLAGTIAAHAGVSNMLVAGGGCVIVGALLYARRLPGRDLLTESKR